MPKVIQWIFWYIQFLYVDRNTDDWVDAINIATLRVRHVIEVHNNSVRARRRGDYINDIPPYFRAPQRELLQMLDKDTIYELPRRGIILRNEWS